MSCFISEITLCVRFPPLADLDAAAMWRSTQSDPRTTPLPLSLSSTRFPLISDPDSASTLAPPLTGLAVLTVTYYPTYFYLLIFRWKNVFFFILPKASFTNVYLEVKRRLSITLTLNKTQNDFEHPPVRRTAQSPASFRYSFIWTEAAVWSEWVFYLQWGAWLISPRWLL